MGQWCPVQLALARAFAMPPRKRQAAALNALTHAVAEPVAANVLNSRATAVRTAVSGSSTTRPVVSWTSPTGSGVIVGVFDTGIDWSHPDFQNPDGTTRILYIWDLTTTGTAPGTIGGVDFTGGNECSAAVINARSCSEHDVAGHGSHVAGIEMVRKVKA